MDSKEGIKYLDINKLISRFGFTADEEALINEALRIDPMFLKKLESAIINGFFDVKQISKIAQPSGLLHADWVLGGNSLLLQEIRES